MKWLDKEITKANFEEFKRDSIKYGYHLLGEGGYYDTLVLDCPIFNKKIEIIDSEKVIESKYNGYIKINNYKIVNKQIQIIN